MEQLDYSKIIEKIGPEKNMSRLTEEELLFYDMVKAIKSKSADEERHAIQQVIKQFNNQQFILHTNENRINMKTSNKTWIGVAAGVAILVVAYFFLVKPSKSTDQLFSENFKPSTEYIGKARDKAMQFGMASTVTESRDSFLKALKLFEENKYDEAIKILYPFVETYPEDNDARYFLGMSQFYREKYAQATANLSKLNAKPDLDAAMLEEVQYNLALSFLKMVDGKKQAKILFEKINAGQGKYRNQAKSILEYL